MPSDFTSYTETFFLAHLKLYNYTLIHKIYVLNIILHNRDHYFNLSVAEGIPFHINDYTQTVPTHKFIFSLLLRFNQLVTINENTNIWCASFNTMNSCNVYLKI